MTATRFRFDRFILDPAERTLHDGDRAVELSPRYLDALILMVTEAGTLITKDRFLDIVWRGVPVTDEALTQCIKTLRRSLGDDAARPRFIATAPKHGYRFIAPVELAGSVASAVTTLQTVRHDWRAALLLAGAGTLGAGVAGIIGGLLYGIAADGRQIGGASTILVMLWLTLVIALLGGAGVSAGIAATRAVAPAWRIAGGAGGGLLVGGIVNLVGLDAFDLLLGRSPGGITGAPEGLLLGAAVGAGSWAAERWPGSLYRRTAVAGVIGGAGGVVIVLLGGRLMGGSLDLLARSFPDSRLGFTRLFGGGGLSGTAALLTAALEGLLFSACLVGAMLIAERRMKTTTPT